MEQKIMGYIINPPFSTKDRIFKLEPELAISAAYKSEEKPTTTKVTAKTINFIFDVKCVSLQFLSYNASAFIAYLKP